MLKNNLAKPYFGGRKQAEGTESIPANN